MATARLLKTTEKTFLATFLKFFDGREITISLISTHANWRIERLTK